MIGRWLISIKISMQPKHQLSFGMPFYPVQHTFLIRFLSNKVSPLNQLFQWKPDRFFKLMFTITSSARLHAFLPCWPLEMFIPFPYIFFFSFLFFFCFQIAQWNVTSSLLKIQNLFFANIFFVYHCSWNATF